MQEVNLSWLRLPDDESALGGLEAGEDTSSEEPNGSQRPTWVPSRLESNPPQADQARSNGRHQRPSDTDGLARVIPESAVGQPLWEVFEGPDERILKRDLVSGHGYVQDGFQVVELVEEAEERAERLSKAHRQIVAAFFGRRKNSLYRQAATSALAQPDRPEPKLVFLYSLLGDRWLVADAQTQAEVNRWLSGLSEEDFLFFTQDPEGDPQRVSGSGILPEDLRPMHLFREQRRRLIRSVISRMKADFFHPDEQVFEAELAQTIPRISRAWNLDEVELVALAREERSRLYRLHLSICKASAAFARSKPAPAHVPEEVAATVASVAYVRMCSSGFKARALTFGQLEANQARMTYARLDRFTKNFYASRLFSFIKRRKKLTRMKSTADAFVKSFQTGIRPKGTDQAFARQVAALAFFENHFTGFRVNGASNHHPNIQYWSQILAWGGFADLNEAGQVYQAIPNHGAIRQLLFLAIRKMDRKTQTA